MIPNLKVFFKTLLGHPVIGKPVDGQILKFVESTGSWMPTNISTTPGGDVSWGTIIGTLTNQTDLNNALMAKANSLHSHIEYALSGHGHTGVYESANANIQNHVTALHAPSNAQKNSDIIQAEIEAKLTGAISTHSHAGGAGLGYAIQFNCPNQATTTDGQTVYWGSKNLAHSTTADIQRIYIPKEGTIKACYIHVHAGTAGTGENWTMNIRLNNTSDTLVQTLGLANAHRVWSNVLLNIAVVAGNYIEIKEVEPTWATNPANIRRSGVIYIE